MTKTKIQDLKPIEISTQDGIRAQFSRAWALIRPSGTEPKMRITVEAEDQGEAEKLYDNVYEVVKGCIAR